MDRYSTYRRRREEEDRRYATALTKSRTVMIVPKTPPTKPKSITATSLTTMYHGSLLNPNSFKWKIQGKMKARKELPIDPIKPRMIYEGKGTEDIQGENKI